MGYYLSCKGCSIKSTEPVNGLIWIPHLNYEEQAVMETYYKPEDLPKFEEIGKEAPELAKKFFEYYGAVFDEGELSEREKALIALAVAHAIQCPYCIDAYTQACLEKGSNLAEMTEAVHVVTAIRGGASLVHGIQMRNHVQKLSI
jgi:alkylhydroperoxidase/carboxymuconolactone decarboxylase family protein